MGSYIKLDRKILKWEWWSDINTYRLFTYMLIRANWKDSYFNGIKIPRGSFVSSLSKLSESTNLTVSEIRTALNHLKDTGEITCTSYNKFTIFKVNNYCLYQSSDNEKKPSKKSQFNDFKQREYANAELEEFFIDEVAKKVNGE